MTRHVVLSILAMLTICMTLISTIGIVVLCGWELNITESTTMSIAVGMSVDFTAHLAHANMRVGQKNPISTASERARLALHEMGSSVAVSAATTALAGHCE